MSVLGELEDRIGASVDQDKLLAQEIGRDLASLVARQALGEDVDEKIEEAQVSLGNLSNSDANRVGTAVSDWFKDVVAIALARVI